MKISPLTIKKSVARKPVNKPATKQTFTLTPCIHAHNGEVWCQTCANTYLNQTRAVYAKALRESGKGEIIRAAQKLLKKAILEYSLTPQGLESLERQYVTLTAQKRMVEANKLREDIKKFRSIASKRNQSARKLAVTKAARRSTIVSTTAKYVQPPTDANGEYTLSECPYLLTQHALERMDERLISKEDIKNTLISPTKIHPAGDGLWKVIGSNNISLIGKFENTDTVKELIVATVYTENTATTEK